MLTLKDIILKKIIKKLMMYSSKYNFGFEYKESMKEFIEFNFSKMDNVVLNYRGNDYEKIHKNLDLLFKTHHLNDGFNSVDKFLSILTSDPDGILNELKEAHFKLRNHFNQDSTRLKRAVIDIIHELFSITKNVFLVGGCIRDILSDNKVKDYDIVTDLHPDELISFFKNKKINGSKIRTSEVGKHFGVVLVKYKEFSFEIATFRKDLNAEGKGAKEVQFGDINDDYQRRDFTINSIYYNPLNSLLIDPTGEGLTDVFSKTLRFNGPPNKRIKEDVIRILRVYKFIKKGFNPDNSTLKATRSNFELLCELGNPQRIREHLEDLVDI